MARLINWLRKRRLRKICGLHCETCPFLQSHYAALADLKNDSHCSQCKYHRKFGGDCIGVSMCGNGRPGWEWCGEEITTMEQLEGLVAV